MNFNIEILNKRFAGKRVRITHDRARAFLNTRGMCKALIKTEGGIDVQLKNGSRIGITPTRITATTISGTFGISNTEQRTATFEPVSDSSSNT